VASLQGKTIMIQVNGLKRTFTFDAKGHTTAGSAPATLRRIGSNALFYTKLTGDLEAELSQGVGLNAKGLPLVAVFRLDGTIAESLLLERGPDVLVGLGDRAEQEHGRQRGSAGGVAQTRQGEQHGNRPLEVLTPSYHSHSSSANAAVTLRTW